jgi:hypothetical protein
MCLGGTHIGTRKITVGIILICLAILALGIFIYRQNWFDGEIMGGFLVIVSGLASTALIIIAIAVQTSQPGTIADYEQDKAYIEASIENDSITDGERAKVMELMLNDNLIIIGNKTWAGNFFVGAFHGYDVGQLELFDFKRMQKAKLNVDLVGGKEK